MASLTSYERERMCNIDKNKARMTQLGVDGAGDGKNANYGIGSTSRGMASRKRSRQRKPPSEDSGAGTLAPRRSERIRKLPASVSYDLANQVLDGIREVWDDGLPDRKPRRKVPQHKQHEPAPGSCRSMRIDRAGLWPSQVGTMLRPDHGLGPKAFVMAKLRGSTSPPRFSKYSGIQEWQDGIALFVNISGKSGEVYENIFFDDFSKMAWFAQKHHHEDTPVIRRLLELTAAPEQQHRVTQASEDAGVDDKDPVFLFIRQEGDAYLFCGRVGLHRFDAASRPLRFEWLLMDRSKLHQSPSLFRQLVRHGNDNGEYNDAAT